MGSEDCQSAIPNPQPLATDARNHRIPDTVADRHDIDQRAADLRVALWVVSGCPQPLSLRSADGPAVRAGRSPCGGPRRLRLVADQHAPHTRTSTPRSIAEPCARRSAGCSSLLLPRLFRYLSRNSPETPFCPLRWVVEVCADTGRSRFRTDVIALSDKVEGILTLSRTWCSPLM